MWLAQSGELKPLGAEERMGGDGWGKTRPRQVTEAGAWPETRPQEHPQGHCAASTQSRGALPGEGMGRGAHLHPLFLVLHTVQLVVLVTVLVLTALQEGDLLQHRAAQALFAIFACRVPAHDRGAGGALVPPGGKAQRWPEPGPGAQGG